MARIKVLWRNQFFSMLFNSSYVKCWLKCLWFLSNIKIEKKLNFDILKNLQKNIKWILSHSIGLMFKYNWWIENKSFKAFFFKFSYVKYGLKCFQFLTTIKIEKKRKNVKWILSHSIGLMFKYNWWIDMKIKIMAITLLLKILVIKTEFWEIGLFKKMA